MSKRIYVPGRMHSVEVGNVMTGANEILDDTKGKKQDVINAETDAELLRLENGKQNALTFDAEPTEDSNNPVKSGGVYSALASIVALIPNDASGLNQLADKAYVVAQIIAATPAFKGLFASLLELQAVENPKTGDLGLVCAKDNDGYDVFIFYQYKNDAWNEYYTLARTPLRKPATTGTSGDYPCNGMGKIELPMNIVSGTWPDNTWLYLPLDGVVYLLYSWRMQLYAVYDEDNEAGLGLDNNIVIQPVGYDITKIADLVGERYMSFTEAGGVYTIIKPDGNTITSTQLNNTTIYNYRDGSDYMVNLLTQAMFTQTNTIYVVQHDYDLNAQNISIPANSTLLFDGGTIKNGTITGNGLKLCAELHYEYMQDVTLAGDYTDETSKSLQTQIDAIVSGNTNVSLTANKSVIFAEVASAVILSATSNKSATLINIKKGSTVLETGSGTSLSTTDNFTPSGAGTITYQANFTILGFVKSTTRSISAVYPVRTGSGTSYVDGVASTTPKTSPVGTYNIVVSENEQYIYINVPAHMNYDIKGKATMGGFDFPLENATDVTIGGVAYKSYRSSNTYNAGTWTIVIS